MNSHPPHVLFERVLAKAYEWLVLRRHLRSWAGGSFVSPYTQILGLENVSIGTGVTILQGGRIIAVPEREGATPHLTIGNGTYIGQYCTLACLNRLHIGHDVTLGDNVYVADGSHSFSDLGKSVMKQPLLTGSITIGDRVWLGKNAVVARNLTIGDNAVVGANSFVSRDVPAYTVVAGIPAVPVKRYDFGKSEWVSVDRALTA